MGIFEVISPITAIVLVGIWTCGLLLLLRNSKSLSKHGLASLILSLGLVGSICVLLTDLNYEVWFGIKSANGIPFSVITPDSLLLLNSVNLIISLLAMSLLFWRWKAGNNLYTTQNQQDTQKLQEEIAQRLEIQKKNEQLIEELERISIVDALTDLYNRRGLKVLAEKQMQISRRTGQFFYLLFGDMDNLKVINDGYGHKAGDEALRQISAILRTSFRESDIIARIGGDEFVVLLTEVTNSKALECAYRLQNHLKEYSSRASTRFPLSMSTGMVRYNPEHHQSFDDLLDEADALMYEQKKRRKQSGSIHLLDMSEISEGIRA